MRTILANSCEGTCIFFSFRFVSGVVYLYLANVCARSRLRNYGMLDKCYMDKIKKKTIVFETPSKKINNAWCTIMLNSLNS